MCTRPNNLHVLLVARGSSTLVTVLFFFPFEEVPQASAVELEFRRPRDCSAWRDETVGVATQVGGNSLNRLSKALAPPEAARPLFNQFRASSSCPFFL